jgi:hypothetical protein
MDLSSPETIKAVGEASSNRPSRPLGLTGVAVRALQFCIQDVHVASHVHTWLGLVWPCLLLNCVAGVRQTHRETHTHTHT